MLALAEVSLRIGLCLACVYRALDAVWRAPEKRMSCSRRGREQLYLLEYMYLATGIANFYLRLKSKLSTMLRFVSTFGAIYTIKKVGKTFTIVLQFQK